MASKTIDWGDGTGDKIYLNYPASSGDQQVAITSDVNGGYVTRSKDITATASGGGTTATRTITINQAGKDIIIITRNGVASTDNNVAVGYE